MFSITVSYTHLFRVLHFTATEADAHAHFGAFLDELTNTRNHNLDIVLVSFRTQTQLFDLDLLLRLSLIHI